MESRGSEGAHIRVLGLDLALTASGACIIEPGFTDVPVAGERWLLKTKPEHSDMERYAYVAEQVQHLLFDGSLGLDCAVDLVACEGVYASRNLLTFGRLTALNAIVQYALHRSQIPYMVLPPAAWRKILFGPGSKIDKERVRVACAQRLKDHLGTLDIEKADLNVIEAMCVGLAAWKAHLDPSLIATKPRRKRAVPAA